jgi:hypothetical protein
MSTATASPGAGTRTAYRITADQIECCNCPPGCNCQFAGTPNHGFCEFLLGLHVRAGMFGAVKLDGVNFVIAMKYPGAIHEGNGNVALFVDQKASDAQVDAVAQLVSGKQGGMPWEALAGTVGRFEGPTRAQVELSVMGTQSSFRIPGVLEVQQTPIKDVVSGADRDVRIVYPKGGFFWNEGSVCTTSTMEVNHKDIKFAHVGCYACTALVTWTNH